MIATTLLILVCLANVLLGSFVFINNPRASLNRIFAALTFSLSIWSAVSFFEDSNISHSMVGLLVMADFVLSALMLLLFYQFCLALTRYKVRVMTWVIWVLAAASVVMILMGQVVRLEFLPNRVKFVEQNGYLVFAILAGLAIFSGLIMLIRKYRHSVGRERAQLAFIFLGLALMSLLLVLTNIILPIWLDVSAIVTRLGIYSILFFTGFSAYSIVKHRFMDIRLVVARSVAYVLLLTTMASLYAVTIFGISQYVFPSSTTTIAETLVNIILAIILAFTFQPLRRFFEKITDRIFFRDRYDSQVVLNTIGKELAAELLLEKLLDSTLKLLCQALNIERGQFFIFNKQKVYKVAHYGPLPERIIVVPELKKLRRRLMVADELEDSEAKRTMTDHGIRISLILRTKEEFVGFLLLGDKLSGDIYSGQDLQLLEILSSELAVAIVNAKAYEEISQFNVTLQTRVDEATKRLRAANTTLRSLDKAKDEFISMASHQLRTPLTTIKGYLSMVLEGDTGKITKDQREFLNYAFGGSERMVGLVSDLLNVSRLQSGKFTIDRAPADVVAMATDEVRQLTTHAEGKNLKLTFDTPKVKFPLISLDENKTRQVMMNFIDNAVYYTKKGSVTVSLELDKPKGVFRFRVRDTGIGVPPEAQSKLFTKFYRAGNAQEARPDGTGLGLYMAKRVVEDQGGKVLFETTIGKGSMFGFEMPIVTTKPTAEPEPKSAESAPKDPLTPIDAATQAPAKTKATKVKVGLS